MTGDAVNDAAALKQADVGVAMGSGSEVSKQAAKIVLTDDNFATLVRAVDLGRDIYRRISTYIRLQLTILSSVLQLMVLRHHPQHQRRRRPVPAAAAVLQVLRRHHRGDRVHRRRPRPRGDAAAAAQARHQDRQPGRRSSAGSSPGSWSPPPPSSVLEWGPGKPSTTHAVGQHDHGLRHRLAQRGQHRPGHAARAPGAVVVAGVPLPGLDHPRLGPHLGRRRARTCSSACSTPSRSADGSGSSCSPCRSSRRRSSRWTRPSSCPASARPTTSSGELKGARKRKSREPEPRSAAVNEQMVNSRHLSIELRDSGHGSQWQFLAADAQPGWRTEFTREWVTKSA